MFFGICCFLACECPHPKLVFCDAIHARPEFTGCAQ
jgi:hypothetical protein